MHEKKERMKFKRFITCWLLLIGSYLGISSTTLVHAGSTDLRIEKGDQVEIHYTVWTANDQGSYIEDNWVFNSDCWINMTPITEDHQNGLILALYENLLGKQVGDSFGPQLFNRCIDLDFNGIDDNTNKKAWTYGHYTHQYYNTSMVLKFKVLDITKPTINQDEGDESEDIIQPYIEKGDKIKLNYTIWRAAENGTYDRDDPIVKRKEWLNVVPITEDNVNGLILGLYNNLLGKEIDDKYGPVFFNRCIDENLDGADDITNATAYTYGKSTHQYFNSCLVLQFIVIDNDKFPQRQDREDIEFIQISSLIGIIAVFSAIGLVLVFSLRKFFKKAVSRSIELAPEAEPEEEVKVGATRIFKKFDAFFKDGLAEISSGLIKQYSNTKSKNSFSINRNQLLEKLYEYFIKSYSELGITKRNLEEHNIKSILERELSNEIYIKYSNLIIERITKIDKA